MALSSAHFKNANTRIGYAATRRQVMVSTVEHAT
jgi:hypothetical protein